MTARVRASDDPAALGPHDIVLSTLKSHQLPALATGIAPLAHAGTTIVVAQNGLPWWLDDRLATLLDPGGALDGAIPRAALLGGVIYSANAAVAPGHVVNSSPTRNRLIVGAVDGAASESAAAVRVVLEGAGIDSPATPPLRVAIWTKVAANLSVSVPAFLVERTSREVFDDPVLGPMGRAVAEEIAAVAAATGVAISTERAPPAPGHFSSMLQDHRLGRPAETRALIEAPLVLARLLGVSTPVSDHLAADIATKLADRPSRT